MDRPMLPGEDTVEEVRRLFALQAARQMLPSGGTVLFTGASASLRGRAGFEAFSSGKAGLRAIAQSMAREFAPQGLHVAHVVIDVLGSNSEIVFESLPIDDPMQRRPDISKAKRLLGWEPKVELEKGLKLSLEYFRRAVAEAIAEKKQRAYRERGSEPEDGEGVLHS